MYICRNKDEISSLNRFQLTSYFYKSFSFNYKIDLIHWMGKLRIYLSLSKSKNSQFDALVVKDIQEIVTSTIQVCNYLVKTDKIIFFLFQ